MAMTTELTPSELKARLKALGLFGLIACCDEIIDKSWLREVLAIEERERQKRGLERRTRDAHVGAAKPMADFDWAWPRKIDRQAIEELFTLACIETGHKLPPQRGQGTHRRPRQAANQETPSVLSLHHSPVNFTALRRGFHR
jgi:hypothetical protein